MKVKSPTGQAIHLDIDESWTVQDAKEEVMDRMGIPLRKQRMLFETQVLSNDALLVSYGISNDSEIRVQGNLSAGCAESCHCGRCFGESATCRCNIV